MINIIVFGDFCLYNEFHNSVLSISPELSQLIAKCDVACVNLECPITNQSKSIFKTGPALKANPAAVDTLAGIGINMCVMANNHIMDFGVTGIKDTVEALNSKQISWLGVKGMEKLPYSVLDLHDKKIAFIAFTENEYSTIPVGGVCAVPMDFAEQYHVIRHLRDVVDYIVVQYHGGVELYPYPTPNQRKYCKYLVDVGADVVICHHSHCLSGSEIYQGKTIYYGLGNFYFPEEGAEAGWYHGLGVEIKIADELSSNPIPLHYDENSHYLHIQLSTNCLVLRRFVELSCEIAATGFIETTWNSFSASHSYSIISVMMNLSIVERVLARLFGKTKYIRWRLTLNMVNLLRCESHREKLVSSIMHFFY